jgi:hypothetical protein
LIPGYVNGGDIYKLTTDKTPFQGFVTATNLQLETAINFQATLSAVGQLDGAIEIFETEQICLHRS